MKPYIIGMDIGGTNVRIAMGCREESPRHFRKVPRQTVLPGEAPAKRIGEFIREYCRRNGEERLPQAVVIGFPATLDRARRRVVQAPNIPGLDGLSAEELERELDVPVYLEKDVNLLFACDREDLASRTAGSPSASTSAPASATRSTTTAIRCPGKTARRAPHGRFSVGEADIFHLDVMDGSFVYNYALGLGDVQCIRRRT